MSESQQDDTTNKSSTQESSVDIRADTEELSMSSDENESKTPTKRPRSSSNDGNKSKKKKKLDDLDDDVKEEEEEMEEEEEKDDDDYNPNASNSESPIGSDEEELNSEDGKKPKKKKKHHSTSTKTTTPRHELREKGKSQSSYQDISSDYDEDDEDEKEKGMGDISDFSGDDDDDGSDEYCYICGKHGELLCCEKCPKVFHLKCLKLDKIPDGEWVCPVCSGQHIEPLKKCSKCKRQCDPNSKSTRLCGDCGKIYHFSCLQHMKFSTLFPTPTPSLTPDGSSTTSISNPAPWLCDDCCTHICEICQKKVTKELRCNVCRIAFHFSCGKVKKGDTKKINSFTCLDCKSGKRVERILARRKISTMQQKNQTTEKKKKTEQTNQQKQETQEPSTSPKLSKTPQIVCPVPQTPNTAEEEEERKRNDSERGNIINEFEFFVKWKNKSHLHDSWIIERRLHGFAPIMLKNYQRRIMSAEYNNNNNNNNDAIDDGENDNDSIDDEEEDLMELARSEWTHVDRILSKKQDKEKDGKVQYFVKWRGLGYDEATWEDENLISTEFREEIETFERANDLSLKLTKRKPIPPSEKDFKEMKKQPQFIPLDLFDYQREGCSWLMYSWCKQRNVILADEMGLGKTITCISFLSCLSHIKFNEGPFLIIAPLSTITNWEREFKLWAPHFNVVTYLGTEPARRIVQDNEFYYFDKHHKKTSTTKFNVLLTSYDIALVDSNVLKHFTWEVLCVDEGHRLKNQKSKLFKDLENIKTKFRMLMTGTPLQNDLQELFNMMKFLCVEGFEKPEELYKQQFESLAEEQVITKLHDLLRPYMLRRIKKDVLRDMPEKAEYLVQVDLSPLQKQYYRAILTKNYEFLRSSGSRSSSGHGHIQAKLLNTLSALQKICNHPYLMPEVEPAGLSVDEEFQRLVEASGKLSLVDKMLKRLKEQGHRVLLFSQQTTLLDIVEDFIRYRGYSYSRIDGATRGAERQNIIDLYNKENSPLFLLLLSTRACRLGINLATADTVIIYDSDWNPHNDIQALSRAHRIGQKNKVMVYQLVSRHTVEEKIIERARSKLLLEHLVVQKMKDEFKKGELDELLRYGAQHLFKEGEEGERDRIRYGDPEIEKLLDRNRPTEPENDAQQQQSQHDKENAANDKYFGGLKVARVWETGKDKEEKLEDEGLAVTLSAETFWDKLLKERAEELRLQQEKELGVGKRVRKTVSYVTPTFSSDDSDESGDDDNSDDKKKSTTQIEDEDFAVKSDEDKKGSSSSEDLSGWDEEDSDAPGGKIRRPRISKKQKQKPKHDQQQQQQIEGIDFNNTHTGEEEAKQMGNAEIVVKKRKRPKSTGIRAIKWQMSRPSAQQQQQVPQGTEQSPIDIEAFEAQRIEIALRERTIGDEFMKHNDSVSAIMHYSEALRLSPHDFEVLYHRARAYTLLNDFPRALDDLKLLLQIKQDFPFAYILMAHIYASAGPAHYNEMYTVYQYALNQLPNDKAMKEKLELIITAVNPQFSIHQASSSLTASPNTRNGTSENPVVLDLTGSNQQQKQQQQQLLPPPQQQLLPDAETVISELAKVGLVPKIRPQPNIPQPPLMTKEQMEVVTRYKGKGNELLRAHRFDDAVRAFTIAINVNPFNAALYNNRAAAYLFLERHADAASDCEVAITLDNNHYRAYCNLGTAFLGLGRFKDAIEFGFAWAIRLQPTNQDVRCGIDQALMKLGFPPFAGSQSL